MLRPLCLLVTVLLVATPVGATAPEDRPLRLVTFNLLHGGPWSGLTGRDDRLEARLSLMAAQLRALDPDIVALQESPVTRWRGDIAARLAAALGFSAVHARATERAFAWRWVGRVIVGALGFVEGPAILSRFPIVASEVYDLPHCAKRIDPRVAVRADVATPAGVLAVFSTHTSRDDCQTRQVAALARAHRGALPAVVMGDLNTIESAPAFQELLAQGFETVFQVRSATPILFQPDDARQIGIRQALQLVGEAGLPAMQSVAPGLQFLWKPVSAMGSFQRLCDGIGVRQ